MQIAPYFMDLGIPISACNMRVATDCKGRKRSASKRCNRCSMVMTFFTMSAPGLLIVVFDLKCLMANRPLALLLLTFQEKVFLWA